MNNTKNKTVVIYAAVIAAVTSEIHPKGIRQLEELRNLADLRNYRIIDEYIDYIPDYHSFKTRLPRFEFNKMMRSARHKNFDILLVYRLDQVACSVKDLSKTLIEFDSLDIDFISYSNEIDTTISNGNQIFNTIRGIADLEKDLTQERAKKSPGRRPKIVALRSEAMSLFKDGNSFREIGRRIGVAESTVRNWLSDKKPKAIKK